MKSELTIVGDRVWVRTPYSPAVVDRLKAIPGKQPHFVEGKHGKNCRGYNCRGCVFDAWSYPAVRDVVLMVCDVVGMLPWMLEGDLRKIAGPNGVEAVHRVALDESVVNGHHFLTPPYKHQRTNLARLIQNDRWILADEMGTGKTHPVVNRIKEPDRVWLQQLKLVISPKSVRSVWVDELLKHGEVPCRVINSPTDHVKCYVGNPLVTITNYEQLLRREEEFLSESWDMIVLDEVHRVKNFTAKTSKIVRKLTAKAKYVWALSGTPAPNGLEDWFGVLSAVDPNLLKDDFGNPINTQTAFEARYVVKGRLGGDGPFVITGYRNVGELHDYISSITSRVTKAECLDLPDKVYSTRRVTLEGEQKRVYAELKKDAIARINQWECERHSQKYENEEGIIVSKYGGKLVDPETATLTVNNILTESLRLLQIVGGFVPDDLGAQHSFPEKAKLAALEDILEELGDKQCVIWCAFRAEVDFLSTWLDKHYAVKQDKLVQKTCVSKFTGESSTEERSDAVERFKTGEARYFVGTASAGGLGINGLQVADCEVYYSRDWNLATYLQSQDRLHRIGQKNAVSVINIVASGTVDEKVAEALERKASLQEMLLKNPEEIF